MRKKHLVVAAALMSAITMAAPCAFAAEETEQETGTIVEIGEEADAESAAEETEAETEAETNAEEEAETETGEEDPHIEASALLSQHLEDIGYEKGELDEDGWVSKYLNMQFVPAEGIVMGVEENATLQEYHDRNGEENAVAVSEMVAYSEDEQSFVQMMVEVNPNAESDEDILGRLAANEELEEVTDARTVEIAGKEFLSTTGELDGDRYFLAVSTEQDGVAMAIKMKYENALMRRDLTNCFDVVEEAEEEDAAIEEDTEAVSEEGSEAAAEEDAEAVTEDVAMPEEFEDASTEVQTEEETETVEEETAEEE